MAYRGSSMGQKGDPRDFNADKLGIAAMQQEREFDQQNEMANRELARQHGQLVSFSNLGPLPDMRWRAFTGGLSRNSDKVSGAEGLSMSRFNEMTPFYNAQFGGDVSNKYDTQGLMPQVGGSLAGPKPAAAKLAQAALKRNTKGRR